MPRNKYYYSDGTSRISTKRDLNKVLHRTDGPAEIDNVYGAKIKRYWWIDDICYSEEYFNQTISAVKALDPILQLTDPRWWVREMAKNDKR